MGGKPAWGGAFKVTMKVFLARELIVKKTCIMHCCAVDRFIVGVRIERSRVFLLCVCILVKFSYSN